MVSNMLQIFVFNKVEEYVNNKVYKIKSFITDNYVLPNIS